MIDSKEVKNKEKNNETLPNLQNDSKIRRAPAQQ